MSARPVIDPKDFKHFTVNLNGINLHYVDEGSGSKVIVLCHGWPDLWYGWRHQIKPLARAGFRVIVPDLRGFGGSDAPVGHQNYTFKVITGDLVALLDHLKVDRAIFLGHDWGGEVVWKMTLYHPSRVLAVGAVCTPFTARHDEFIPLETLVEFLPAFRYQLFLISDAAPKELNANAERFFRIIFRSSDKDDSAGGNPMRSDSTIIGTLDPPKSKIMSQQELDYYSGQYKKRGFEGGLNYYKTRQLNWELEANLPKRIDHHPALMVTAGRDFILTPKLAAGMKKNISNLTTGHVEEAGHWVLFEQPDQVNKILIDWLKSLPASPSKSKL